MNLNFRKISLSFILVQTSPIWGLWYINSLGRIVNRSIALDNSVIKLICQKDDKELS